MKNITLSVDEDVLESAREYARRQHTSVNALIVAAAARAKCRTLWSEDLNAGQQVLGFRVCNPLEM